MIPPAVAVTDASSSRAMPKSITLTLPALSSITFSGFRSRWTMPCVCASCSAAQIWRRDLDAFAQAHRAHAVDDRAQALALDVFHREVGGGAGARELVDAGDVLVGDAA